MDILKKFLCRIGHFLLSIVRVLGRAICCRRRKEADYLLPITVDQVSGLHKSPDLYEYQSQWGTWPDTETSSNVAQSNLSAEKSMDGQMFHQEESPDDFFKDMVPQIRKPKKIYIRKEVDEMEEKNSSNRLAMDPKAIIADPDLGILEDNPSNWEEENLEELWDPNQLIRETKRAEREKRLAEHQRRKQERESRRASRQDSSSNMAILNLSDSKAKFS